MNFVAKFFNYDLMPLVLFGCIRYLPPESRKMNSKRAQQMPIE